MENYTNSHQLVESGILVPHEIGHADASEKLWQTRT